MGLERKKLFRVRKVQICHLHSSDVCFKCFFIFRELLCVSVSVCILVSLCLSVSLCISVCLCISYVLSFVLRFVGQVVSQSQSQQSMSLSIFVGGSSTCFRFFIVGSPHITVSKTLNFPSSLTPSLTRSNTFPSRHVMSQLTNGCNLCNFQADDIFPYRNANLSIFFFFTLLPSRLIYIVNAIDVNRIMLIPH